MRGADTFTESLFTMRHLDDFVPENHPLRIVKRLSVKVSAPRIWYLWSCNFYNVWAFKPVDIIGRYFSSLLGPSSNATILLDRALQSALTGTTANDPDICR